MRRIALLLIAMPMIALSFGPQVREMMLAIASRDAFDLGPVTDGLVAYWSMREDDGTVFDEHGSNDGTAEGGVSFAEAYGVRNDGADYDGSTGYIDVGTIGDWGSNLGEGTIAFWLKTTSTDWGATMGQRYGSTEFWLLMHINSAVEVSIGHLAFQTIDNDGKRLIVATTDNVNFHDGDWHHIVYTWVSAQNIVKIYFDGDEVDATNGLQESPANFSDFTGNFLLGARTSTGNAAERHIQGSMDEVVVYDRVLSQEEITFEYDRNKAGAGH